MARINTRQTLRGATYGQGAGRSMSSWPSNASRRSSPTGARTVDNVFQVHYVSAMKSRPGGFSSVGLLESGRWGLVIPRDVLFSWFNVTGGDSEGNEEGKTLYKVLMVNQQSRDDDIKKAYRRMVKQWHPDVCKEEGARDTFEMIQRAYSVLSDDRKRAKYDAILEWKKLEEEKNSDPWAFDEALERKLVWDTITYWKPPLRCGQINVLGHGSGKWFVAEEILSWDDIVNEKGKVLSTSYVDNKLVKEWV